MTAGHASWRQQQRRKDAAFALLLLAGLAGLVLIALWVQGLSHDLRAARDDRAALAQQVRELGGKPVAGPPGPSGKSVTGPRGPKGDQGEPGKDAPTITPSPGPAGPAGENGADSTVPGPTGPPGADSTIPGPSGAPGKDGKDGTDGRDGADGNPPAGWTFEYGGVTYTCHPVNDFDPDNPQYACDASEPSPGQKNSGQGPLNLALDPSRRRY